MAAFLPFLVRPVGEVPRLGDPWLDEYLRFVAARARPNTVAAHAFDLKVFFTVIGKPPAAVTTADVLGFIEAQRAARRGPNVVRLADGEAGLARGRSSGGWRRCRACSPIWTLAGWSRSTRFRGVWRPGGRAGSGCR